MIKPKTKHFQIDYSPGFFLVTDNELNNFHIFDDIVKGVWESCDGNHSPEEIAAKNNLSTKEVVETLASLESKGLLINQNMGRRMFFASSFITIGMTMACHTGAQASDHVNYSGIHNDHGFNPAPFIPLLGFIKTGRKHPHIDIPDTPKEELPPVDYPDVPPEVIIPPTNNTVPPVTSVPPEENSPPSEFITPPVGNNIPPSKTIPKAPPTKHNKPPVKPPLHHNKPPTKQHHTPKKPKVPVKPIPPGIPKGELPKTGGVGSGFFYALGIGIASIGLFLMKGNKDEEVETTGP